MTDTQTSKRNSALASRHVDLGATFDQWNGMDVPLEYAQDLNREHKAVRATAGLIDVSGLKKVFFTGPDAQEVCNHASSRDLTKIYPGKSVYTVILDNNGLINDDCVMFHLCPDCWLVVHSSGKTLECLKESAKGKDVSIQAWRKSQKTTTYGLVSDCKETMKIDAGVYLEDKKIGYVTAPVYSKVMMKSVAMFRKDLEYAKPGFQVEVRGESVACQTQTSDVPLLDPKKAKRTGCSKTA